MYEEMWKKDFSLQRQADAELFIKEALDYRDEIRDEDIMKHRLIGLGTALGGTALDYGMGEVPGVPTSSGIGASLGLSALGDLAEQRITKPENKHHAKALDKIRFARTMGDLAGTATSLGTLAANPSSKAVRYGLPLAAELGTREIAFQRLRSKSRHNKEASRRVYVPDHPEHSMFLPRKDELQSAGITMSDWQKLKKKHGVTAQHLTSEISQAAGAAESGDPTAGTGYAAMDRYVGSGVKQLRDSEKKDGYVTGAFSDNWMNNEVMRKHYDTKGNLIKKASSKKIKNRILAGSAALGAAALGGREAYLSGKTPSGITRREANALAQDKKEELLGKKKGKLGKLKRKLGKKMDENRAAAIAGTAALGGTIGGLSAHQALKRIKSTV